MNQPQSYPPLYVVHENMPVVSPPITRRELQAALRRTPHVRAVTESMERMSASKRALLRLLPNEEDISLAASHPRTRGDCSGVQRPCPFVSCKFNLYLDVNEKTGAIKFNFPHLEPHEMVHSCALDVADDGPKTLHEVAEKFALVRERVRQVEDIALGKLAPLLSFVDTDGTPTIPMTVVEPEGWTEP